MKHCTWSSSFPDSQHHRSCQTSMDISLVMQRPRSTMAGCKAVEARCKHNLAVRAAWFTQVQVLATAAVVGALTPCKDAPALP